LVEGLAKLGVNCHAGEPAIDDEAIVVLLPNELALLEKTVESVNQNQRLVPVVVGTVSPETVPAALAELNWLSWRGSDAISFMSRLVELCVGTVDEHRAFDLLQARAEGWQVGGRSASDLPTSRKALRESRVIAQGVTAPLPELIRDYLRAVAKATRRALLWRVMRLLAIAGLVVLLVMASVNVVKLLRNASQRQALAPVVMNDVGISAFPAGTAVQISAYGYLTEEAGREVDDHTRGVLVELLSQHWPMARFQMSPTGKMVNAVVLDNDGGMLWADGGGDVWLVDGSTMAASLLDHFSESPLYKIAASADWDLIGALDSSGALIVRDKGVITREDAAGATRVAVAVQQVVAWSEDTLWVHTPEPTGLVMTKPGLVLAVEPVGGRLYALVSTEGALELLDCLSGETLAVIAQSLTEPPSRAAISPEGHVAYESADGQLWAWLGDTLLPTGLQPIDYTTALALTANDELLYSTSSQGTQFYDLKRELRLFSVCGSTASNSFSISPLGNLVVCSLGADKQVWSLDEARPVGLGAPRPPTEQVQARSADGRSVARLGEEGLLEITVSESTEIFDSSGMGSGVALPGTQRIAGKVRALAFGPNDQFALGTADGSVLIYDVRPGPTLQLARRWVAPDGTPATSISISERHFEVTTSTATWVAATCPGCSSSFQALLSEVQTRALACYPPLMLDTVPLSVMAVLGFEVCEV